MKSPAARGMRYSQTASYTAQEEGKRPPAAAAKPIERDIMGADSTAPMRVRVSRDCSSSETVQMHVEGPDMTCC